MLKHPRRQSQWWRSPVPYAVVASWTAATAIWLFLALQRANAFKNAVEIVRWQRGQVREKPRLPGEVFAGLDLNREVDDIRFDYCQFEDLQMLRPFEKTLHTLEFYECQLSSKAFAEFDRLPRLRSLQLQRCRFEPGLFAATRVSVQKLDLSDSNATDETVRELRRWDFSEIDLSGTQITDVGLRLLCERPSVFAIYLRDTPVDDASLSKLPTTCTALYLLDLSGTKVTDASLPVLARLPALSDLTLRKTSVTALGLETHLLKGKQLQRLDVQETAITYDEKTRIRRLMPLLQLE